VDPGEAAQQRRAVPWLELVEARAVEDASQRGAGVPGGSPVRGHDAAELARVEERRLDFRFWFFFFRSSTTLLQAGDRPPHQGCGVRLRLGQRIGDAAPSRVELPTSQLFGRDVLARRRFDQGGATQENGAVVPNDDHLVAEGRDVGPACRAGAGD